jgi:hypothetical protein
MGRRENGQGKDSGRRRSGEQLVQKWDLFDRINKIYRI